jgi:hypothetical protein
VKLTANEVSLVGAFGGAVVGGVISLLVARYTIRRGPNYESQIKGVYDVLASLAKTQEAFRVQHETFRRMDKNEREKERIKAQAALWRPKGSNHIGSRGQ